jgi:hypothetical protein
VVVVVAAANEVGGPVEVVDVVVTVVDVDSVGEVAEGVVSSGRSACIPAQAVTPVAASSAIKTCRGRTTAKSVARPPPDGGWSG